MPSIYRISRPDPDAITDVDSVYAIEGPIRAVAPGRYHVDEIGRHPIPSGHASRRWGTAIKRSGDQCTLGPTPRRTDDRGMLRELPDDLVSKMGCRTAYGEAARLAEMSRFDHGWGRHFAAQVGGEAEAIEREVMQRVGHEIHPELIKLAIRDAIEQRKPRW
jgi:hypothetical protein